MKRSIIVANWKMYATSIADAHLLATSTRNNVADLKNLEVILCPPSIWLTEVADILRKNNKTILGAQNMFYETDGAYTGEISPLMVKEIADYVIIGHSERREHFDESDMEINEKVLAALKHGLVPIICVGENEEGSDLDQPIKELREAIDHVPTSEYRKIIVAYEPVWAISAAGKGKSADPSYVAKVVTRLREFLHSDTPILYGGSVNSGNIAEYAKRPEIDGVLVGSASTKSSEFNNICKIWAENKTVGQIQLKEDNARSN